MNVLDSSLLVAALAPEEDAPEAMARIEKTPNLVTSPIVLFETVLALCRLRQAPVSDMTFVVQEFLVQARVSIQPISADLYISALAAHARYGKGVSPAKLNMGDCFSYALAKQSGGALLYKGGDFAQTDLA